MNALRHSRRFGRFLAAWLLLWFCAMAMPAAVPLAVPPAWQAAHEARAQDADAHDCDEHDATAATPHAAHGEHGSGAAQHCPLCLHAAAPPSGAPVVRLPQAAPASLATAAVVAAPRVRTDSPPPARAPPAVS